MTEKAGLDQNYGSSRIEEDVKAYWRWSAGHTPTSLTDSSERCSASSAITGGSVTMDELIRKVGFILRIPIFCAGIVLWTVVVMPVTFLFMLAQVIGIPFVFLSAAFSNDTQKFRDHIEHTFSFDESLRIARDLKSWLVRPA